MNASVFSFRAFGFPVHVTWTALFLLFILGAQEAGAGVDGAALGRAGLFAGVVFFSILVHELGHALVGRRLGLEPTEIVFHGFGGECRYRRRASPKQGVVSALAGPLAGISLGLLALGLQQVVPAEAPHGVHVLLGHLVWVNLFWSAFNLLPIYPMDGGAVLVSGLQMRIKPLTAWRITQAVSVALAVAVGVAGFLAGFRFVPIIMVLIVLQNLRRGGR